MGAALEGIVRQRSGIGVEKFTSEHPIEISDKLSEPQFLRKTSTVVCKMHISEFFSAQPPSNMLKSKQEFQHGRREN